MTLPRRMTYEEFRQLPGDERYELLEGELLVTPAPSRRHQSISMALSGLLWAFTSEHGLGKVLCAPLDLILSDSNILQPDILYLARDNQSSREQGDGLFGTPDLVVEILSPSSLKRDTVEKRLLYSAHGVLEYWIVDPDTETIEILTQQGTGLEIWQRFTKEGQLTSALFPGLQVDLSTVFDY